MKVQLLISVMNQKDTSILEQMNVQSDAIVVNQCDENLIQNVEYKGHDIKWMSLQERGVGRSRNTALERAEADIVIFVDDDEKFVDGYQEMVVQAFEENPKADVIFFHVPSNNPQRENPKILEGKQIFYHNCLKYGTFNIAARLDKIRKKNIKFSLMFGGGSVYGSGEDSLFITDCLKRGLKIYTNPYIMAYADQKESTWFHGYNDKYFFDKGALFACMSKKLAGLLCLQFALRHKDTFGKEYTVDKLLELMKAGREEWNSL